MDECEIRGLKEQVNIDRDWILIAEIETPRGSF